MDLQGKIKLEEAWEGRRGGLVGPLSEVYSEYVFVGDEVQ